MTRGPVRTLAALGVAAVTSLAATAGAGPTVWSRARDPRVTLSDAAVRDPQRAYVRYRRMLAAQDPRAPSIAAMVLRDTRVTLAGLVDRGSADFSVRLLYAAVLRDSNLLDESAKVLTKLLADRPPAPLRADALTELAILHAQAGRREDEIRAYTAALEIEPHGLARSTLLANRAEAMMAMGDVTAAVEGYRAALAPLTTVELFWRGSTALFSLGVALDRAGNPEAGMESVKLARSYDPIDRALRRKSGWFFSPAYDEHWYWALGGWMCGRTSESLAVRAECYEKAIAEWGEYVERAPESDPWVALAHVRLATVKRERDELRRALDAKRQAEPPRGGR